MRTLSVGLALALPVMSPAAAQAKGKRKKITQIVPPQKQEEPKPDPNNLSEDGRRRGITEITLGSITGAAALALIGRGIWEINEGKQMQAQCAADPFSDVACERRNPGNGGYIAAGLSFALTVPFGVASGLLLARGIKINRAYEKWKASGGKVAVHATPTHAVVSLSLRF